MRSLENRLLWREIRVIWVEKDRGCPVDIACGAIQQVTVVAARELRASHPRIWR